MAAVTMIGSDNGCNNGNGGRGNDGLTAMATPTAAVVVMATTMVAEVVMVTAMATSMAAVAVMATGIAMATAATSVGVAMNTTAATALVKGTDNNQFKAAVEDKTAGGGGNGKSKGSSDGNGNSGDGSGNNWAAIATAMAAVVFFCGLDFFWCVLIHVE